MLPRPPCSKDNRSSVCDNGPALWVRSCGSTNISERKAVESSGVCAPRKNSCRRALGGKKTSLQAGAAFEEQRRRHGGVPLARITPHWGLRATTVSTSVCLSGLEHCRFGKSGEPWVVCPIKHTFGIWPLKGFLRKWTIRCEFLKCFDVFLWTNKTSLG